MKLTDHLTGGACLLYIGAILISLVAYLALPVAIIYYLVTH